MATEAEIEDGLIQEFMGRPRQSDLYYVRACDMTDAELLREAHRVETRIEKGFSEGGGSPGEWWYERRDELKAEATTRDGINAILALPVSGEVDQESVALFNEAIANGKQRLTGNIDLVGELKSYAMDWRNRAASNLPILDAIEEIKRLRIELAEAAVKETELVGRFSCKNCGGSGIEFVAAGHGNINEEPCSWCSGASSDVSATDLVGMFETETQALPMGASSPVGWASKYNAQMDIVRHLKSLIGMKEGA